MVLQWSSGTWNAIKHAFSHLHSFTRCIYPDSATFWGLIALLSEQYLQLCHYSATLLHQLTWVFFIGKGVHSLPARAGLLWSWLLYKLHSDRSTRCSERQLSPQHAWQLGKRMEPLPCWEQQILCVLLLCGTGAPGSCWAPSYSSWSQCAS